MADRSFKIDFDWTVYGLLVGKKFISSPSMFAPSAHISTPRTVVKCKIKIIRKLSTLNIRFYFDSRIKVIIFLWV